MKKIMILTYVIILQLAFIYSSEITPHEFEFKINEILTSEVQEEESLIGLKYKFNLNELFSGVSVRLIFDENYESTEYFAYRFRLNEHFILIMAQNYDEDGLKTIMDVEIIDINNGDEILTSPSGVVDGKRVHFFVVLTNKASYFSDSEVLEYYRLVYFFDWKEEKIINMTEREIVVFNDD